MKLLLLFRVRHVYMACLAHRKVQKAFIEVFGYFIFQTFVVNRKLVCY